MTPAASPPLIPATAYRALIDYDVSPVHPNRTQEHPAVRVHAESGNKALFVNQQYTVGLADFYPHEASPLLERLFRHSTQESFTCRWQWEAGDVAFWDNRCVQHMVMADVSGHRRYMHRTTVAGEVPIPV